MDPETVDLAALVERMRTRAPNAPIGDYLVGKTWFRDIVVSELGCSELEAEQIVDTLILRRLLIYSGDPQSASTLGAWHLE
jgi:hypothetical protein